MGHGTFDPAAYRSYASTTAGKSASAIYTSRGMSASLNPKGVIRESRDSDDHPKSTPIIVALDVTGSMGILAQNIAQEGLGVLFQGILDRQPVTDPHIMFMGVGDVAYDKSPLQVSQFESSNVIIDQLKDLYLENGGGGNSTESYNLPWHFAAFHTSIDSYDKRGRKGYLFTIGDENAPNPLTTAQLKEVLGTAPEIEYTNEQLLKIVARRYNVFHIIIEQGNHASMYLKDVVASWTSVLGQRALRLSDYTALAETIVSAIQVTEGEDADKAALSWGKKSSAVHSAVKDLPKTRVAGLLR